MIIPNFRNPLYASRSEVQLELVAAQCPETHRKVYSREATQNEVETHLLALVLPAYLISKV